MNEKAIRLKLATYSGELLKFNLKENFLMLFYIKKRGYLAILLHFKKDHVQSPRA